VTCSDAIAVVAIAKRMNASAQIGSVEARGEARLGRTFGEAMR